MRISRIRAAAGFVLLGLGLSLTPYGRKQAQIAAEPVIPSISANQIYVSTNSQRGVVTRSVTEEEIAPPRHDAPLHELKTRASARAGRNIPQALFINIQATSQLEQYPQAKTALLNAVAKWESIIQNQIAIDIEVDFGPNYFGQPFATPNTVSVTNTQEVPIGSATSYRRVIEGLRDAGFEPRQAVLFAALPNERLNSEVGYAEFTSLAAPIGRALGILPANPDPLRERTVGATPSIGLNANVKYDFDPRDGIDADKLDFEAIVMREVGRILGFTSNVGNGELRPERATYLTTWDYFRFRPGVKFSSLTEDERAQLSGGEHVFFAGGEEWPLSTGKANGTGGDGNPAGHWKDDVLTGRYIGIMDPTLAYGERGGITAADLEAIQVMGYQVALNTPAFEVASRDDGSREETFTLNGALALTRINPARYPAQLDSIRVQLPLPEDGGSLAGTQLRIVALVDPHSTGQPPANLSSAQWLVDRTITLAAVPENRMLEVMLPNSPTLAAGDLYIGVQASSPKVLLGMDASSTQSRSYVSTDNGASFQPLLRADNTPLNLIARAAFTESFDVTPVAAMEIVSPERIVAGSSDFTLTVYGRNFQNDGQDDLHQDSILLWNGQRKVTTVLNGGVLQAEISSLDVAQAGTARITILTPTWDGERESAALGYQISANNPAPILTRLSPDEAVVGSGRVDVSVFGRNFVRGSIVRWNGADRGTTFVNSTELRFSAFTAELATAAIVPIVVFTPGPGGGLSTGQRFQIAPCRYELGALASSTSSLGGSGSVTVTTGQQCRWTVKTDESWLRIPTAQTSKTGKGIVLFDVFPNSTPNGRAGTLTVAGQTLTLRQVGRLTTVSAARYMGGVPTSSIGTIFGGGLASTTQEASGPGLPLNLAGTEVRVSDYVGSLRSSSLFFVSPGQINFLMPNGLKIDEDPLFPLGLSGRIYVYTNGVLAGDGLVVLERVSPGLFMANSDGVGPPVGTLLRVKANGQQQYEDLAVYDETRKRFVSRTIELGEEGDSLYLILFGTGIRQRKALNSVTAKLAEVSGTVVYAGPQGSYAGLDQINVLLPRNVRGRGEVRLVINIEGKDANQGRITFQ